MVNDKQTLLRTAQDSWLISLNDQALKKSNIHHLAKLHDHRSGHINHFFQVNLGQLTTKQMQQLLVDKSVKFSPLNHVKTPRGKVAHKILEMLRHQNSPSYVSFDLTREGKLLAGQQRKANNLTLPQKPAHTKTAFNPYSLFAQQESARNKNVVNAANVVDAASEKVAQLLQSKFGNHGEIICRRSDEFGTFDMGFSDHQQAERVFRAAQHNSGESLAVTFANQVLGGETKPIFDERGNSFPHVLRFRIPRHAQEFLKSLNSAHSGQWFKDIMKLTDVQMLSAKPRFARTAKVSQPDHQPATTLRPTLSLRTARVT